MGCLGTILSFFILVFHFLFFSIWGWLILLFVFVPIIGRKLQKRAKLRAFIDSQRSQLVNPKNTEARYQLGVLYLELGRHRAALKVLEEAYEIGGGEKKILISLSEAAIRSGNPKRALNVLTELFATGIGDGEDRAHLLRARSLDSLGRGPDALEEYEKALEINESNVEAYARLARLARRLGRREKANAAILELRRTYSSLPLFARKRARKWYLASFFIWFG